MPPKDGPSCPGCGLANYEGLCAVCSGDETRARDEGLPFPWPEDEPETGRTA
jgi:hypothetical protein